MTACFVHVICKLYNASVIDIGEIRQLLLSTVIIYGAHKGTSREKII